MVVEPNAIDLKRAENATKLLHAISAVGSMERANSLPAAGRRRWLAVGTDRRGIGIVLQELRHVHRVEFGEHLQAQFVIAIDLLRREASRTDPDGVDSKISRRLAVIEDLARISAIDATDGNPRARIEWVRRFLARRMTIENGPGSGG